MAVNHNKLRVAAVPAALAASFLLAACGEQVKTRTVTVTAAAPKIGKSHKPKPSKHVLTKSEMPLPLFPSNADYERASTAASDAADVFDFEQSQTDLKRVIDPRIKAQAERAIDLAAAEVAADDVAVSFDFSSAASNIKRIENPKLRQEVNQAIDFMHAEVAVDDALASYDYDQARKDASLVRSPSVKAEAGRIIELEKNGKEAKAFALDDKYDLDGKALNIAASLGDRADNLTAMLDRHSPSYHHQYEEAPDK